MGNIKFVLKSIFVKISYAEILFHLGNELKQKESYTLDL